MASSNDNVSMALFCDFENVALGVRDANYEKFDIKPVLERLLLKGSIVVKKAYCDWDRYKGFKGPMHEANFELIEIPHVRMSGKNSADIRMVVDALDLCYTKAHVNTFVIISGDSDFSPLVSKLRENNKKVIGVGVKDSTSDLLVANCDEFIFYDDLVREKSRNAKRDPREQPPKRSPEEEKRKRDEMDKRRNQAVDIAYETFDALVTERGDSGKIWASVLKEAIKRRKPDFSESFYGFRTFGNLLEEMKARGLLEFGRDEKSGAYVYRGSQPAQALGADTSAETEAREPAEQQGQEAAEVRGEARETREAREARQEGRGRGRGNRGGRNRRGGAEPADAAAQPMVDLEAQEVAVALEAAAQDYAAEVRSAEDALNDLAPAPADVTLDDDSMPSPWPASQPAADEGDADAADDVQEAVTEVPAKRPRSPRKPAAKKPARTSKVAKAAADAADAVDAVLVPEPAADPAPEPAPVAAAVPDSETEAVTAAGDAADTEAGGAKKGRKPGTHKAPARSRLPRKPKPKAEG
ncbi:NYN domain-containing protein [Pseudoduganella buxea]|uniref:NYN domain-containing protein n=1 Tax=Pseudoduganella buxea TaxID=1949069 RepID=A0A6I3SSI6_9BURK|nr:NYN domain-containing protein [Pseudoduganella buxea]MTV51656.1 NYN domain-containing protein [Pseudoduganella buxea]GGC04930.1 hypothetical protein GCM10011572_28500 [Pseudoduganella buxea]